ncbi:MAG: TlpA disulfide reductase family protein [Acidobacteriota bacterium]
MRRLLFFFATTALCAQTSADELISRMTSAYSNLTAIRIAAVREDELAAVGNSQVSSSEYDFAVRGRERVRLMAKQSGQEVWLVSDGEATWKASSTEKKWARMNVASVDSDDEDEEASEPQQDFRGSAQHFLIGRMVAIGKLARGAVLVKEDTYKLDKERIACGIVRVRIGANVNELWIDKNRGFVLQAVQTGKVNAGGREGQVKITMKVKRLEVGDAVPDSLFAFTAPKGWSETEMIVLPMEERAQLTGQRAAGFTLKALDGNEMSLAGLRGKVVVMDFWATWCPPCRKELPELEKLHKELSAEGVVFVGVNNEDTGTVKGFVSKNSYAIPVLLDSKREVHRRYGVRAIPTLFIVDREGTIRQHFIGSRSQEQIRAAILEVAKR